MTVATFAVSNGYLTAKTEKDDKYHQRYARLQSTGSDQKCHIYKYRTLQNEWKLVCNIFRPLVDYRKEKL